MNLQDVLNQYKKLPTDADLEGQKAAAKEALETAKQALVEGTSVNPPESAEALPATMAEIAGKSEEEEQSEAESEEEATPRRGKKKRTTRGRKRKSSEEVVQTDDEEGATEQAKDQGAELREAVTRVRAVASGLGLRTWISFELEGES